MGFEGFFNKDGSKVARYEEFSKNATSEEKREFEAELLVPQELPAYGGAPPTADAIEDLSVRLVFSTEEDMALFAKYFKVSHYVEKSVHELNLLLSILELIEQGVISYDKKTGKVSAASRRRSR